jgi:hypothetical protein
MSDRPPFWSETASRMLGKTVLVGKTITVGDGAAEHIQFYGTIEAVDERQGLAIRRADNGELEWLPPDLRAFHPAEPGVYTLNSTGENVSDPDFISTWTASHPERETRPADGKGG